MTLHPIDHVLFLLIAAVLPVVDFFWLRRRAERIRAGHTELRMTMYRTIIWEAWVRALLILTLWFGFGRGARELGLTWVTGALAWSGYVLATLICVILLVQMKSVIARPECHASVREKLGWLAFLTPHTLRERRVFDVVSVSAGVCEEVVFRGFAVAYLASLLGAPFWAAALLSSVVFGVAHAYQGPRGVVRTGAVGLMLASLYVMTGALWAPMAVHIVLDLTSGRISHAALTHNGPERSSSELAA